MSYESYEQELSTEYYELVPKNIDRNLLYRREIIQRATGDRQLQQGLWRMSASDHLFYINTFVWTYNPKKVIQPVIPMVTWDYQDDAFYDIMRSIIVGSDDLIEKSRDMGASWLCLLAYEYMFHFKDFQSFLLVSRNQNLVDKKEDPDSLMWKLDFVWRFQPKWIAPLVNRTLLHIYNRENGSTIDGTTSTGDVSRGGRRTSIMLDEFASDKQGHQVLRASRDTTNSRLFNSTPKGSGNAFYDMRQTGIHKIRMHWTEHPEKAAGLYTSVDGKLEICDLSYDFPVDYQFILDGKLRSPWYDNECKRAAHPMEIAQELDIDYLGSDFQFFDPANIEDIGESLVKKPLYQGELEYDYDTLEPIRFVEKPNGRLKLWLRLKNGLIDPSVRAIEGADVSAGTGASNSALSIVSQKTCEKLAEFASPHVRPEDFARDAIAIAKFFRAAFLIWDAGGPGRNFGGNVVDKYKYRNIYYRRDDKSISKKVSDIPGFFMTGDNRLSLLGNYRRALTMGEFTQRSSLSNKECLQYVFTQNGDVVHSKSRDTTDPSGAKSNHADRVVAYALVFKGYELFRNSDYPQVQRRRPKNCFAERREKAMAARKDNSWLP